jgi:hypothetical protein
MAPDVLFLLLPCVLLRTTSLTRCNRDLQVQESRSFLSDAKVKSIQDVLLLNDSYTPSKPLSPQSNRRHHGYRPHQDTHQSRSELSRYRQQQKHGYEIYEEPDVPGSNTQRSTSLQPSNGYLWTPAFASSKGNVKLQKMNPGLSEPGLLYYPYIIVRSQEDGTKQLVKPTVSGVQLPYQGTSTQFRGNAGDLLNCHVSRGQYHQALSVIPAEVLGSLNGAQPNVSPLAALLLASSLG